jgi:hypothetical protein
VFELLEPGTGSEGKGRISGVPEEEGSEVVVTVATGWTAGGAVLLAAFAIEDSTCVFTVVVGEGVAVQSMTGTLTLIGWMPSLPPDLGV